ncbi:uncharacterized protein [Clytia hemisphaerica]|uniref:uncharacterized protein n=1 Tax=Clytia hemisphaerica TaxID=252671 RepID=UPI0034D3FF81
MDDIRNSPIRFKASDKQVYNKVKSIVRRGKDKSVKNDERKPSNNNKQKPSNNNKRKPIRRTSLFSQEEVDIIQMKCRAMMKKKGGQRITEENVKYALAGEALLKRYTFVQLRTRIQYEKNQTQLSSSESSSSESSSSESSYSELSASETSDTE